MIVLVDATMLDGGPSGAATRLAALGAEHRAAGRVRVIHLVRPGLDPLPGLECRPFGGASTPAGRALAGRRLAALARAEGAVLFAAGALPLPRLGALPIALTLHDLRFLDARGGASRWRRLWARHRLGPHLARASALACVSRSTADEVVRRGLLPAARVHVVPNAGTPGLQRLDEQAELAAFRRRAGMNRRYALALGPLAAVKRPRFLLQALAAARRDARAGDLGLVWAGRADEEAAFAFARAAEEAGLAEVVRVTGVLDARQLATAYSAADALVVAGACEGFSIPVIDAQRLRVPVVAVRAGALPETAGETAWLAAPDDARDFGARLAQAVTPDAERSARLDAAERAAARWSWTDSAERLQSLWRTLVPEAERA